MNRRSFLTRFGVAVVAVTGTVFAQKQAIMIQGKAKVCENDGSTLKCPNGHETCRNIDAPIAVGNGSYDLSAVAAVRSKIMEECDVCHVLFIAQ